MDRRAIKNSPIFRNLFVCIAWPRCGICACFRLNRSDKYLYIFAFENLLQILSAEANMKTPKNFTQCFGVFNSSMILVGVLYGIIGVCGYIKYGQATAGTITLNIPTNAMSVLIIFNNFPFFHLPIFAP